MAVRAIPEGYDTVTPYLLVDDAESFIAFLRDAFDAEELYRSTRPDGVIWHAEVKLGTSRLMLSQATAEWPAQPGRFHLYVEDADAVYRQAQAAGATSSMEPANQFYGDRMCGVKDAFGNEWWIATHVEDVPPDELKRREAEYQAQQAASAGTAGAPAA